MSYSPTTWNTGDTITASKMNKIENGVAEGSSLICNCTYNSSTDKYTLDKTLQEIYNALLVGTPVYIKYVYGTVLTSFSSVISLSPIIKIYTYATDIVRIMALKSSSHVYTIDTKTYTCTPSVTIYEATGWNDYPTLYSVVSTTSSSCATEGVPD